MVEHDCEANELAKLIASDAVAADPARHRQQVEDADRAVAGQPESAVCSECGKALPTSRASRRVNV